MVRMGYYSLLPDHLYFTKVMEFMVPVHSVNNKPNHFSKQLTHVFSFYGFIFFGYLKASDDFLVPGKAGYF